MTETANPNCFYEIEQKIMEDTKKNALVKTITYIQKTKQNMKKSEVEKLNQWMDTLKEQRDYVERMPNIKGEGVTFNEGILENNIKQKMFYHKEKALRQKFEKEHSAKYGDSQGKTLEEMQKNAQKTSIKVKFSNVMFYRDNEQQQIEQLQVIVENAVQDAQEQLGINYIRCNSRNFTRRNQRNNTNELLDYIMFYFETEEQAQAFLNHMNGKTFNSCILEGEILKPRFQ